MDALTGWWDDYLWGAVVLGQVFVCSLILMIVFGLLGAMAKISNSRTAQKIASAYTVIFRGTPEILVTTRRPAMAAYPSSLESQWVYALK